jgi:hypothetical protein
MVVSALLIGMSFIVPAFGAYADIPKNPEVHFTQHIQKTVFIGKDFTATVKAVDDRSSYYKGMIAKPLNNANVTVKITSAYNDIVLDKLTGKTNKYGFWSGAEKIQTPLYKNHGLYNVTVSIQYGDSVDTQKFQFWTTVKSYGSNNNG